MNYLKLFQTHEEYEAFVSGGTMMKPNVSHCVQENDVHYNPIEQLAYDCYWRPIVYQNNNLYILVDNMGRVLTSSNDYFKALITDSLSNEYVYPCWFIKANELNAILANQPQSSWGTYEGITVSEDDGSSIYQVDILGLERFHEKLDYDDVNKSMDYHGDDGIIGVYPN